MASRCRREEERSVCGLGGNNEEWTFIAPMRADLDSIRLNKKELERDMLKGLTNMFMLPCGLEH